MVTETDLLLGDGRTLHVYQAAPGADDRDAVVWHHGTPNIGAPPEPLLAAAAARGLRWVSYDRPGYGGSTPAPGRRLASAAEDVAAVADALGVDRYAVMGHSGGANHALASPALRPDRVVAAVCVSALAPFDAAGLDWFAGMAPAGSDELRAATRGAAELERLLSSTEWDPEQFTPADHAALEGPWGWLGTVAGLAVEGGHGGMVEDDLAYVAPWAFDPAAVKPPVLLVHGGQDRVAPAAHARWLASTIPSAELRMTPEDGHISVLRVAEAALDWLQDRFRGRRA